MRDRAAAHIRPRRRSLDPVLAAGRNEQMSVRRMLSVTTASLAAAAVCTACTGGDTPNKTNNGALILNLAHTGDAVQRVFNPYLPVNAFQIGSQYEIYEPLVQVNKITAESYKP